MKKIIISFLFTVIFAFSAIGICACAEEAEQASTQSTAAVTASAVTEAEEVSTDISGRDDDEDPFADVDNFEIPKSFYIGGGVLAVFVIASVVVLIMGKPKEK